MVAAKPLLAAALIALVSSAAALADRPTVRISAADQAAAVAALLHKADFGAGWRGGKTTTSPISASPCAGFDPKESDLVVTGHADARFTFQEGGVELDQDVEVLASDAAVQKDFARTISPQLGTCLAAQIRKAANVVDASVVKIPFPRTGSVSAAYRATLAVHGDGGHGKLISDFVFFGQGRLEYSFNVIAPAGAEDQLVRFESALAKILLKRAAKAMA